MSGFDELRTTHQGQIYRLCLRYLGDTEAASDATQEVFILAFRHLRNFRGDCTLSTWLHRIAINVALSQMERRQRVPLPLSTLEPHDSTFLEPAEPGDTPAAAFARRERGLAVHRALATLPEHQRLVLLLFDIEGYTYKEIGQMLDLPGGTVKSRLNRARAALRQRLAPYQDLFLN